MLQPLAWIIEHDQRLAGIYSVAVQAAGFETEIIPDGHTALDRLASTAPALVLLDLRRPYRSGREILRRIRDDERFAQTRVMLTMGNLLAAADFKDEADLVLVKPVGFHQLCHLATGLLPN
jgi:DNA-binding response OmpR family regulator